MSRYANSAVPRRVNAMVIVMGWALFASEGTLLQGKISLEVGRLSCHLMIKSSCSGFLRAQVTMAPLFSSKVGMGTTEGGRDNQLEYRKKGLEPIFALIF